MASMSASESRSNLVRVIREQAERRGDDPLYTFLLDGEADGPSETLGFAAVEERARAIAALLQESVPAGERALLLYPPGLDYGAAFFGCLFARVIAVPAYPPDPARLERTLPRLRAIVRDSGARYALTTSPLLAMAGAVFAPLEDLASLRWLATNDVPAARASGWRDTEGAGGISGDTLAFLQYTSGSTSAPKGVMVSHGNLLHNLELIRCACAFSPTSHMVNWLPQYHDMGLVSGLLLPVYVGMRATLMSPLAFLQDPMRWLRAITRVGGTAGGAPNFAYDLCVRRARPSALAALDLSTWRTAYNGAEPIRAHTVERFAQTFAACGFRRSAMMPCYGLAEVTVGASFNLHPEGPVVAAVRAAALQEGRVEDAGDDAGDRERRLLVGCGRSPSADHEILVVDADTRAPCPPGRVGEIWIRSPSVGQGYWNRPDETRETFQATVAGGDGRPALRTGDLGFLRDGDLYVTGRRKDLLIIAGRNHAPQDIELTVERSHAAVRPGCVAAFSVEIDGAERLGVVAEIDPRKAPPPQEVVAAVRQAVHEEHELPVLAGALLEPGGIPKTSSGKIQRHAARAGLASGALPVVARFEGGAIPPPRPI